MQQGHLWEVQTKSYADALNALLDASVGLLVSYEKDAKQLSEARIQLLNNAEASKLRIIKPCKNMKDHLATVRKVIAKRDRKKIDYDRFTTAVHKQQAATTGVHDSPAHKAKLDEAHRELQNSTAEYEKENLILREQIPKVLAILRKFFSTMLEQEHIFQAETLKLLKDFYEPLAQISHISNSEKSLQSQAIVETWRSQYMECKQAVEEHLDIIRSSKIPAMTMSQTGKTDGMVSVAPPAFVSDQPGPSHAQEHKPSLPTRPGQLNTDADAPPDYVGPSQPVSYRKS